MDDWEAHCQLMLKALAGLDFAAFHAYVRLFGYMCSLPCVCAAVAYMRLRIGGED